MTPTGVTRHNVNRHNVKNHGASGNATGILAMLGSMAAFVANDSLIKVIHESVPLGELILIRSVFAAILMIIFGLATGTLSWPTAVPRTLLGARFVGEVLTTILYLTGLVLLPIADAIAILQCTPLVITAAAAMVLNEPVGWRRWTATIVGFLGVLLIVRPGTTAFSLPALLVLAAVLSAALRDLTTRYIPMTFSTTTLTILSAVAGIVAGLMFWPFETWSVPRWQDVLMIALCAVFLSLAFAFVIIAMRNGEVAVVSPFRYSVILFAILSGYAIWRQLPDPVQLLGIAIVVLAGVYTFYRERMLTRATGLPPLAS